MIEISIVVTTYNRYEFLVQCLNSISNQKIHNKEIIVIDDNSNDKRYDNLQKQFGIRYIKNKKNIGASESRKIGLCIAQGKYIVFMDDDDYYTDDLFLYKAVDILEKNSNLAFTSANANLLINNKIVKGNKFKKKGCIKNNIYIKDFQTKLLKPYSTFTTVFRSSIIKKEEISNMNMFNDSSIYLRALFYGDVYFMDDIIGIYRIHSNNMSKKLDIDFIMKNIDEKFNISKSMNIVFSINGEKWFLEQLKLTITYFMVDSQTDIKTSILLLKNCLSFLSRGKTSFFIHWLKLELAGLRRTYLKND